MPKRPAKPAAKPAPKFDGWAKSRQQAVARMDDWENLLSGMGDANRDKRLSTRYARPRPLTRQQRYDLYIGDDLMRRCIERIPYEMMREGVKIPADVDGDLADAMVDLRVREKFTEALITARVQGGAAILIGANDSKALSAPMDESALSSIDYLTVFDAEECRPIQWYDDPFAPSFGEAKLYQLWPTTMPGSTLPNMMGRVVHESRILRFEGLLAPRTYRSEYYDWGCSVVDLIYNVVRDTVSAYNGVGLLLTEFVQNVYKIQGLAEKLNADEPEVVLARLRALDMSRSMARAIPLDAELEEFERKSPTAVSGLADLLDRMNIRVSAAAETPVTLLWGTSPGGMNATGESDHNNFFNQVKSRQIAMLDPNYRKLLRVIVKARRIQGILDGRTKQRKNVLFTFAPLWQPSDLEISERNWNQAQADEKYVINGVLTPGEIAQSRFGGGAFSMDTVLDPAVTERLSPQEVAAQAAEVAQANTLETQQQAADLAPDPVAPKPAAE